MSPEKLLQRAPAGGVITSAETKVLGLLRLRLRLLLKPCSSFLEVFELFFSWDKFGFPLEDLLVAEMYRYLSLGCARNDLFQPLGLCSSTFGGWPARDTSSVV